MAQFTRNPPLNETDLLPSPQAQLQRWLDDAVAVEMQEPTAMTLATVGSDGRPSARIVLFKGFHDDGLKFFTNLESHKGQDIAAHPDVALVFWWDRLERSVRIEGRAEKLPPEIAKEYFYTRPRGSQLGALTSRQSRPVATRAELDARLDANEKKYVGQDVPFPEFWGGYLVRPQRMEFWQGRRGRLHDRLRYQRDGGGWRIERL
ncbi:MAG TPA: pyridoxamine 5'-phosphate oxidase, partial [Stenotrophobium sp.]|nr:pyridoxamine 5'-phosphate oxidase [Stenotrophobium sp.]